MPKYTYKCTDCEYSFRAFHGISENLNNCPQCEGEDNLVREINKIFVKKQKTDDSNHRVGDLTKQFIEDNRTILNEYKEELTEVEHNDIKDLTD